MLTQKAIETARRNLAHRLDRYFAILEKREASIGKREGDHLLRALDHLQSGSFDAGERDVMWAELASRQADAVDAHPTVSVTVLRERLAVIVGAGE